MKPEKAQIFLSYARKDMGEVKKLYELLKGYGFSPWMDVFSLKTGQDWLEVVLETIEKAPIFIACLSNHSITKTGVVRREINEALEVAKERILSGEDVYIFPVRLEEIEAEKLPRKLRQYNWVDWYSEDGKRKLIQDLKDALKKLGFDNPLNLRSQPLENLSPADAAAMIKERNFYDRKWWSDGRGINHEYEPKAINGNKVIIDHTTGLMWQEVGSVCFNYEKARAYINRLCRDKFAGQDKWRLPTLEEAMSLMEAKQNQDTGLYINSLFNKEQRWIWTADKHSQANALYVIFYDGGFFNLDAQYGDHFVRAVCSL